MPNRKVQIREIFREYKYLFDEKKVNVERDGIIALGPKSDDGFQQIWVPKYLSCDTKQNGLPLKEKVGFILIQETIKNGKVVAYCYSFESDQYLCTTSCTITGQEDKGKAFWCHYDRERDDVPHCPHVTVLYPSIRYISRPVGLKEFLSFIEKTFFKESAGVWRKKGGPIWVSRM